MRAFFLGLLAATTFVAADHGKADADLAWFQSEIDLLAKLQARLTGSPTHNILIAHIESSLKAIGFFVQSDTISFSYNDPPVVQPILAVHGQLQSIQLAGAIPYSGTNLSTVTGKLVNVMTTNSSAATDWAPAKGAIAIANLTNTALNFNTLFGTWSTLPVPFPAAIGVPAVSAVGGTNLAAAADAGVRGVVYVWDGISTELADAQYIPFQESNPAIPGVFVATSKAAEQLVAAAASGSTGTLSLPEVRIPNVHSRTLYVVVPGTDKSLRNETAILSTHTDGVNALEENGHIALLHYAKQLKAHPPRRTTILLFVTGHMHYGQLVPAPQRATNVWLSAHPELWNGTVGKTAVFGSCVEHLGGVKFVENLSKNTYTITDALEPEWLFASSSSLASLTQELWSGVEPNITRVLNPNTGQIPQSGEGRPLLVAGIPEVSLVTSPPWLLKIYGKDFDERKLINTEALARQVLSFERIWDAADQMGASEFK
ncbi:hypothetical protein FB45DRAFT_907485 [Roridomyces roridus]|uniref:Peptide hydrolase n=1 Tax=Roridomyces roridus TaxID=1738132 RepID=A0AAD7C3N6_9AGAR|nr:hypothetical protein FB45DRAFT_907485 [Roridomyces roridus]